MKRLLFVLITLVLLLTSVFPVFAVEDAPIEEIQYEEIEGGEAEIPPPDAEVGEFVVEQVGPLPSGTLSFVASATDSYKVSYLDSGWTTSITTKVKVECDAGNGFIRIVSKSFSTNVMFGAYSTVYAWRYPSVPSGWQKPQITGKAMNRFLKNGVKKREYDVYIQTKCTVLSPTSVKFTFTKWKNQTYP